MTKIPDPSRSRSGGRSARRALRTTSNFDMLPDLMNRHWMRQKSETLIVAN